MLASKIFLTLFAMAATTSSAFAYNSYVSGDREAGYVIPAPFRREYDGHTLVARSGPRGQANPIKPEGVPQFNTARRGPRNPATVKNPNSDSQDGLLGAKPVGNGYFASRPPNRENTVIRIPGNTS